MQQQIALITGTTSGLGASLSELLLEKGYNLIFINRSRDRTLPLVQRLATIRPEAVVDIFEADLADQDAIRTVAEAIVSKYSSIDALFNNAGVLLGKLSFSKYDNEMHFQVNTLAPYMLMQLLRPALNASKNGIILNVSSGAIFRTGSLIIDELRRPPKLRKLFGAYGQSKLALTTLTNALAPEYANDGIILRSMDPGPNKTVMTAGSGMPRPLVFLRHLFFKSPAKGAFDIYEAAFDSKFNDQSGVYIVGGKVKSPPKDSLDPLIQKNLVDLCHDLTGL